MRGLKRNPWLFGLGVLLAILVVYGGEARAFPNDVTTDQSGSIVIFPKVVAAGTRDTLIQITNTSNSPVLAHCVYIATGTCSTTESQHCTANAECPSGETCLLSCTEDDFDIFLTAQQPTMWRASTGRAQPCASIACKKGDPYCTCKLDPASGSLLCPGSQFGPGVNGCGGLAVKPVGTNFIGELKCFQVTPNEEPPRPFSGNALKGEAVIENLTNGQVSEYNAVAIPGLSGNNMDNTLKLLDAQSPVSGVNEYGSCPGSIVINHYADDAPEPFTGAHVTTEITLVPCTELPGLVATRSIVSFKIFDEMESSISVDGVNFDCYFSRRLRDIDAGLQFDPVLDAMAGIFRKMRVTPSSSMLCLTGTNRGGVCTSDAQCPGAASGLGCAPAPSVIGVAEEFYQTTGKPDADGSAAFNAFVDRPPNASPRFDTIVLPAF